MKSRFYKIFITLILALFISTQPQVLSKNKENNNSLSPVGMVIGGAIAPAYIGVDYGFKFANWSLDYVISPIGNGIFEATSYIMRTTGKGIEIGYNYIISPISDGLLWVIVNTLEGADKIADYTLFPMIEGVGYIIEPVMEGINWLGDYTIVPIMQGTWDGFVWTSGRR